MERNNQFIFATNEFFYKWEKGNADHELLQTITHDALPKIMRKVPYQDHEDLLMEVVIAVLKSKKNFIENNRETDPYKRAGWLNALVKHKIADYWHSRNPRSNKPKEEIQDPENQWKDETPKTALSLEMLEEINDKRHTPIKLANEPDSMKSAEELVTGSVLDERLHDKMVELYSLNTSPEKLIAFTYSKVIFRYLGDSTSGSPANVKERLDGYSLYHLYNIMIQDLSFSLGVGEIDDVVIPLREKLDALDHNSGRPVGERVFGLSTRKITDGNSRIEARWLPDKKNKRDKENPTPTRKK